MKHVIVGMICWMLLAGGAMPCSAEDRPVVTDMACRAVTVKAAAARLVSTFKPATLCVTCLGLQTRLVGVDTDSKKDRLQRAVHPPVAELPAVGRKSTGLNFETIVSLHPDLVIMYAQKDGVAIADRLVRHGVPAIVILPESLASLYATLRLIASAAGCPERSEQTIGACERVLQQVRARVGDIPRVRRKVVYFASSRGLFSTATGDLLQNEMIEAAGGLNAGGALHGYFKEISPEQFIAWNPDVVTLSQEASARARTMLARPQFAAVAAVAGNRIYTFPSNLAPWDFPSPLSASGILWLAARCYPERFADADVTDEIDRFHRTLFGKTFGELGGTLRDTP